MVNQWIYFTVKSNYRVKKILKKNLVFELLDKAQKELKIVLSDIQRQDKMINCIGYGPWSIKGNKTHHKKMIPVYRGYKKPYLNRKQQISDAIIILKKIFNKEYN